jgi:hypothetical protein
MGPGDIPGVGIARAGAMAAGRVVLLTLSAAAAGAPTLTRHAVGLRRHVVGLSQLLCSIRAMQGCGLRERGVTARRWPGRAWRGGLARPPHGHQGRDPGLCPILRFSDP